MKSFQNASTNSKLYILGLILAVPIVALLILQNSGTISFDLTNLVPPCLFHSLSGLYCPGCGGTRAVKALLEGHLITCFLYHPFVLYCAVIYLLFMASHTAACILHKKSPHKQLTVRGLQAKLSYLYIGVIVILSQWLIKNLLVIFHINTLLYRS